MKGGIKAASNSIVEFYFNIQDLQKISTSTKLVFSEGFFLRKSGTIQVHIVTRTHNLDLGTPLYAHSSRKNQKLSRLHATRKLVQEQVQPDKRKVSHLIKLFEQKRYNTQL